MAPPDGHFGPGKWSLPTPPDVSYLDPTLIRVDPPFRSLQTCLWLGVPFMALFGHFLVIKWVKMAGSKMRVFGSRPPSTQWTRYMYWFSRNDNSEIPPPLLTHCGILGTAVGLLRLCRVCREAIRAHPLGLPQPLRHLDIECPTHIQTFAPLLPYIYLFCFKDFLKCVSMCFYQKILSH